MPGIKNFSINKKSSSLPKILIGAVALLFLLFILNVFVSPIRNCFYALTSPIQKVFWSVGGSSSSFLGSLLNAGSLLKENENLKNENQKLLSQVIFLKSIEQGNEAQSAVSTACQNSGFKVVMAGVMGLDQDDILSINKGSANGIAEGMPVINQQNVLFGKVIKVYKNFSQIMLISNKNSVVNVKVQPNQDDLSGIFEDAEGENLAEEVNGVVKGKGGLSAYLDLIPISSEINLQDVLTTSAIDKSFPKGLLVGKITQKEKDDQKPFQKASVELFFDIGKAENLFVITNYKQPE